MPFFRIFSQSDYLIQMADINSHTERQTVQIQISWLLRSQLIWIYTVCKCREYPGSARQGLRSYTLHKFHTPKGLNTLGRFSAIFTRVITFVTSCLPYHVPTVRVLLSKENVCPFCKMSTLNGKTLLSF